MSPLRRFRAFTSRRDGPSQFLPARPSVTSPLLTSPDNNKRFKYRGWFVAMTATFSILLIFLLVHFVLGDELRDGILIPGPDNLHLYKSAVAHLDIVDQARNDPWTNETRVFQVSLFMPVWNTTCSEERSVPYMRNETAKMCNEQFLGSPTAGVFEAMNYKVCSAANQAQNAQNMSVVVLEPQTNTSRHMYATMARYFTANGVALVLIDHPHDSSVVELDTGPAVFNTGSTQLSSFAPLTAWNSTVTNALNTRIADITTALSHMSSPDLLSRSFPTLRYTGALNTSTYSIIGHGLGGTVATALSLTDPRVRFSINLSGSAPPLNHSSPAPIYFLGRSDFRREHDVRWPHTWQHLTGPATEFDLADSAIMDFSDVPVVVEVAQTHLAKTGLQARGVGTQGPWGNHAVKCFVEAFIKKELLGDLDTGACVRQFHQMVPYMR